MLGSCHACVMTLYGLWGSDSSSEILMQPVPTEEEIQFILDAISEYLTVDVRRSDVMSAWSGIRPLAMDPNSVDTASASRDHVVTKDPDGLITVTGKLSHGTEWLLVDMFFWVLYWQTVQQHA